MNIHVGIPIRSLKELMLRCTHNVQFLFNGSFFRQKDGVAMGSPLGPLLADFFMAKLEGGPLKSAIEGFDCYCRYMDDIFCVADQEQSVPQILATFNSAHSSLQFTVETETNNALAFLDVLVGRREDGSVQRRVYRKKTWTSQYTNFHSFVPLKYKRNLVRCLASRARKICSGDTLEEELKFIQQALQDNGYPDKFIEQYTRPIAQPEQFDCVRKKELYIKIPFKGDVHSERLVQSLRAAVNSTFPAAKLRSVYSTSPVIRMQVKDRLPKLTSSMIIYSFKCVCGASYIGRTVRRLSQRVKEHHPRWLSQGKTGAISSAILGHLVDTGHKIDPENAFNVVYRIPPNRSKAVRVCTLATTEAIAIRLLNPNLCAQKRLVQALQLPWPSVSNSTGSDVSLDPTGERSRQQ